MKIVVPAKREVVRLLGKLVRVQTNEFDGYGRVLSVDSDGEVELAVVECEVSNV